MTPVPLIIGQFELHTRLYKNALLGMDEVCTDRPTDSTNHIGWIAGHLVSTRHMLTGLLGVEAAEPHATLFGNGKGIEAGAAYPTVSECLEHWQAITPLMIEGLKKVTPAQLSNNAPFLTPMGETIDHTLAFFAHHEAYHIGQLGLLRKYFGKEAMKYS